MSRLPSIAAFAACTTILVGCMGNGTARYDGVTMGAGDAIAANTVMQMVDPWPAGVDDTKLRVPADRPLCPPSGCRQNAGAPTSNYGGDR